MRAMLTLVLVACGGDSVQTINQGTGPTDTEHDTTPPVIDHTPVTDSQPFLEEVAIDALVTDDDAGVFVVEVYYKREDSTTWFSKALANTPDTDEWQGGIPGSDVTSAGMNYYLYAMDREGNEAWDPEDGESDAYHFRIDGG